MGLSNLMHGRQAPAQAGQQADPRQTVQQLQNNTGAMLQQAHVNVPQSLQRDPNAMINYLLQSGQVTQQQLQQAQQRMARFMGRK